MHFPGSREKFASLPLLLVIIVTSLVTMIWLNSSPTAELPIIVLAGAIVVGLLLNPKAHFLLILVGAFSVTFGHRSIYIGTAYFIPLQIITTTLALVIFAGNVLRRRPHRQILIPRSYLVFMFFLIMLLLFWIFRGVSVELRILRWASVYLLGTLSFVVVSNYVITLKSVMQLLLTVLIACLLISVLGLIERFAPQVAGLFPWFFSRPETVLTTGFQRTMFSFWGTPGAAIVLTWGVCIAAWLLMFRPSHTTQRTRVFALVCLPIIVVAVYISGSRLNWFAITTCLILLSLLSSRRLVYVPFVVIIGILLFQTLPDDALSRIESFSQTTMIESTETLSLGGRAVLWERYIEYFAANPLTGQGDFQGAAHNSFLDLAGTLGLLPAGAFIVFWLVLNLRVVLFLARSSQAEVKHYAILFAVFLFTWNLQVMTGTVFHNPIYGAPHWLLIAVGWQVTSGRIAAENAA